MNNQQDNSKNREKEAKPPLPGADKARKNKQDGPQDPALARPPEGREADE